MATPSQIGPFRIVGTLGAGGMGQVYEGRHVETGVRCALKTLHNESGLGLEAIRALRREVHALAAIDHPNVVKVLDFDLEGDQPWFAMEYIEGRPFSHWNRAETDETSTADTIVEVASRTTVNDWDGFRAAIRAARRESTHEEQLSNTRAADIEVTEKWEPGPELRTKLTWLGQIARALEYLHALGIVHGDVKPDNALIRNDGLAVLVDFGLVSRRGRRVTREVLERGLTRAQTIAYASPERHLQGDYDARADLYALGCMLYEVFSGEPPFVGPPAAVAIAHVTKQPAPLDSPDSVGEPPPAAIAAMIDSLLRKNPHKRTPYASHLVDLLEAFAIATVEPGIEVPPRRLYLYPPGFVGFDEQFGRVIRAIGSLGTPDAPAMVQVVGPAGSGRSRVLLEVIARTVEASPQVHVVSSDEPLGERLPFASLRFVVDYLVDMAVVGRLRITGDLVWLARLDDRLLELLAPPDRHLYDELAKVDPSTMTAAVARAVTSALRKLAGDRGIVLVVESFDELEPGSRAVVNDALRRASDEPFVVVASTQATIQVDAVFEEVELPPLDESHVATIVSQMLGGTTPDRTTASILREASGGRPGALVDLVHALHEHQLIEHTRVGGWSGAGDYDLADAVRELGRIEGASPRRRLEQLLPRVREIAELAAVLGRTFRLVYLLRVRNEEPGEVLRAVSELVASGIVVETGFMLADGGELKFGSDELHRSLYDAIPDARRKALHRAVAGVIDRDDLVTHAHHLEHAGDADAAYAAWLAAAARAKERYNRALHARCIEGALRVGELSTEERADLELERFQNLVEVMSTEQLEREAKRLLQDDERPATQLDVILEFMRRMTVESRVDDVSTYIDRLREISRSNNPALAARALAGLGSWHRVHDRIERAIELVEQAMTFAERSGDPRVIWQVQHQLGNFYFALGRHTETLPMRERGLELARLLDDRSAEHTALSMLVATRAALGDYKNLADQLAPVIAFQRRAGLLWRLVINLWNVAVTDQILGRFDRVLELVDEMDVVRRRLGVKDDDAPYMGLRARAMAYLGQPEALRIADQACDVARTDEWKAKASLDRAEVLINMGRPELAGRSLGAMRLDDIPAAHRTYFHVLAARIAAERGDWAEMNRELERARGVESESTFRARSQIIAASALVSDGDYERAQTILVPLISQLEEGGFEHESSRARVALAQCHLALGKPVPHDLLAPVFEYVQTQSFEPTAPIQRELALVKASVFE
jgi:serine/threonine protein kinase/tetratricopeptide (TPR) repeat protein